MMPGGFVFRLAIQPSACSSCRRTRIPRSSLRQRQRWSSTSTKSSTTPGYFPPPAEIAQPAYTHLSDRSIIRLQGPDVVDFLNGLLPSKLQPLPNHDYSPIFTTFLSAKGRILYEAFIYPPTESEAEESWYIDVDGRSASALFSHLKKHKLRSKFKLEKVASDDLKVHYIWPSRENTVINEDLRGGRDPRALMGTRFLSSISEPTQFLTALKEQGTALSLNDYTIHRIITGHAEGPTELISGSALPQESNVDFNQGIDFHKGCYLGQELTIRTHHTGVVRKRILPCQIYPVGENSSTYQEVPMFDGSVSVHQPPSEANISKKHAKGRSGRSTGKWLGGVGNIGLALCRLEMMTDVELTAEGTNFDPDGNFTVMWEDGEADSEGKTAIREVEIRPFVPQWLRDSIQAGIVARSDRSKKRRHEDEEDVDAD